MNYIFYGLIVLSIIIGAINGKLPDVVNSILTGAEKSVQIALSLIGVMAFWLGIMKIAEKSGLVEIIAKIIKPVTKRLFDEIPPEDPAIGDIAMNFSANALGLTNAATPIGIKAMQGLQEHNINKKTASNAMCMLLGNEHGRIPAYSCNSNCCFGRSWLQKPDGNYCSDAFGNFFYFCKCDSFGENISKIFSAARSL